MYFTLNPSLIQVLKIFHFLIICLGSGPLVLYGRIKAHLLTCICPVAIILKQGGRSNDHL